MAEEPVKLSAAKPSKPNLVGLTRRRHLNADYSVSGRGNSHEIFLHWDSGPRPRTFHSILPEGDGHEGHAARADEPRRHMGRTEEPGFGATARTQLVSHRQQVLHSLSQRGGAGPPRIPSARAHPTDFGSDGLAGARPRRGSRFEGVGSRGSG